MTIDAVQKTLLKLGGDHCDVSVSMHRFAGQDESHRYESETWGGLIRVRLDHDETVTAQVSGARSGELLVRQLKARLRQELHNHTFARKQRTLAAPQRAISAPLLLEHRS